MIKELKYLTFLVVIISFFFFTAKHYFSDKNIKNFFRSMNVYDKEITEYSKNLEVLSSNTEIFIEYVENNQSKSKKKYKFWELIFKDEK